MSYKYDTIVYIGRFQIFHNAHLETIKRALRLAKQVIIAVGSYKRPRTLKNPLPAEERVNQIKRALKTELGEEQGWTDYPQEFERRIKFIMVRDHIYDDNKWAAEIGSKSMEQGVSQDKRTCLIGHYKDDSSYYLDMFPQWDAIRVENMWGLNSTDIRKDLFKNKSIRQDTQIPDSIHKDVEEWINKSEYADILRDEYAFNERYKEDHQFRNPKIKYQPTAVTVDAVVIKSGHVLMIKRGFHPGKGLWALPGGFVNSNERIQAAMLRELKEETRIQVDNVLLKDKIVHKACEVFDHPKRSERMRTITHAFLIDLGTGPLPTIKAGDDAKGAHWVRIMDLHEIEAETFEDHYDILMKMINRF